MTDDSAGRAEMTDDQPAAELEMQGHCLCGAVRFRLAGSPTAFDLCHCARCRAASGSAFLAELEFRVAEFEWISGQSLVKTYEAPVRRTAPGYQRAFCTICGGPVPIVEPVIRVPAGILDDDPGAAPRRHIFIDFKAPWFEIADALPRHGTKPRSS
jgi:hypothetical protein